MHGQQNIKITARYLHCGTKLYCI